MNYWKLKKYQLEKQVSWYPLEQVDTVNKWIEEIVWNTWSNGFRECIKSLLLLQPFWISSVLQTQMSKHLLMQAIRYLVSLRKTCGSLNSISLGPDKQVQDNGKSKGIYVSQNLKSAILVNQSGQCSLFLYFLSNNLWTLVVKSIMLVQIQKLFHFGSTKPCPGRG